MKGLKLTLILIAAFVVAIGFSSMAVAFHGGGVAHCDGCHSMHNSADGVTMIEGDANDQLLKGSDSSSTCLNCHDGSGGYHIASDDGTNVNQGGDFYWVKTDYAYPGRTGSKTSKGENRGHNIVAIDFPAYIADTTHTVAPGGSYAVGLLGCTSCHDAHGQVMDGTKGGSQPVSASGSYGDADPTDGSILGNYRLLGDSKYEAGLKGADDHDFNFDAPIATAINIRGSSYGAQVDYGSGMSEWCSNCHTFAGGVQNKHVAGDNETLGAAIAMNYNSYIATGDWAGGGANIATAYDSLVPFERGTTDRTALDPTSTVGPDGNANVMCLTCHRAHASANSDMGRWEFTVDELAKSPVLLATDLLGTEIPFYADGVEVDVVALYGHYQRSLCNKCHAQD